MEHPSNIYITVHTLINLLGFGIPESLRAIHNYRSEIRMQKASLISDHPLLMGMTDFVGLERRTKLMQITDYTRMGQLFILTIQEVISRSGADLWELDHTLLLSTTRGDVDLLNELPADSPVFLWKTAERVGDFLGATNQVEAISNACISGVSAPTVAKRRTGSGHYERVIVAGGDTFSRFIISGLLPFRFISTRLCRPYDMQRDGLSLGEACGAVLLKTQGNANYIILPGGVVSNNVNRISGPSRTGGGLALAIDQAMEEAGIFPEDISFINAYGTATVYNDEIGSKVIHLAGLAAVPVDSLKPYSGHILGASGIIETILRVEQLKEGGYYGVSGHETLGVSMLITVYVTHRPIPMKCCIETTSGFGSCNATLILPLPDAHLEQKTNSQVIDKVNAPPVCKATMELGNMVTIRSGTIESKGVIVSSSSETDPASFIREAYEHLGENNVKLHKMDNPCKLGYVAAEYLLKDTNYHPKEVGIILANAFSSLDTDCRHQIIISKEGDEAASPAVFVYTLPNVVSEEVCVRHKVQGENTFFARRQSDAASLEDHAGIVTTKSELRTCIIGWYELLNGHYQAEFKQPNNILAICG